MRSGRPPGMFYVLIDHTGFGDEAVLTKQNAGIQ